jgi:hypothetical protein
MKKITKAISFGQFFLIVIYFSSQHKYRTRPKGPGFGLPAEGTSMVFPLLRQFAGVMEWWSIAKYQIPSTRFQGFRCHSGTRCQVSGVREEKKS